MEATENNLDGSIESAAEALLTPTETEKEPEAVKETQAEEAEVEETVEEEEEVEEQEESEEDEDEINQDTENEDDAVQTEQSFTVKIDGEEKAVTLEELKQGFSGQKYVQKGMQENAQMRKQSCTVPLAR